MPVSVEVDGKIVPDTFNEKTLIEFYSSGQINGKSNIVTAPPSSQQISDLITNDIAPSYDYAFCQTISKRVSPTFDNFQSAANGISKKARKIRNDLGIEHSFHMSCLNTGSTISGCGLIAIYADMILNTGKSYRDFLKIIKSFTKAVHCYGTVTDVLYTRTRALDKGLKTISLPAALIGKAVGLNPVVQIKYDHITTPVAKKRGIENSIDSMLYYARSRVKEGLYAPIVNINYAGDIQNLKNLTSFQKLAATAEKKNVRILTGVMGLASGVVFGPGAATLGIAPKNQKAVPK